MLTAHARKTNTVPDVPGLASLMFFTICGPNKTRARSVSSQQARGVAAGIESLAMCVASIYHILGNLHTIDFTGKPGKTFHISRSSKFAS